MAVPREDSAVLRVELDRLVPHPLDLARQHGLHGPVGLGQVLHPAADQREHRLVVVPLRRLQDDAVLSAELRRQLRCHRASPSPAPNHQQLASCTEGNVNTLPQNKGQSDLLVLLLGGSRHAQLPAAH